MWDGVRRGGDVAGDGDCPWRGGGARRLGRLTPLASGRGDVDRPACRGRSKEKATGHRDGWLGGARAGLANRRVWM